MSDSGSGPRKFLLAFRDGWSSCPRGAAPTTAFGSAGTAPLRVDRQRCAGQASPIGQASRPQRPGLNPRFLTPTEQVDQQRWVIKSPVAILGFGTVSVRRAASNDQRLQAPTARAPSMALRFRASATATAEGGPGKDPLSEKRFRSPRPTRTTPVVGLSRPATASMAYAPASSAHWQPPGPSWPRGPCQRVPRGQRSQRIRPLPGLPFGPGSTAPLLGGPRSVQSLDHRSSSSPRSADHPPPPWPRGSH